MIVPLHVAGAKKKNDLGSAKKKGACPNRAMKYNIATAQHTYISSMWIPAVALWSSYYTLDLTDM